MSQPEFLILWCAFLLLLFVLATRKLWTDPDRYWEEHREQVARARSQGRHSIRGLPIDVWGFENHRDRYIWFSRIAVGLFMLILVAIIVLELFGLLPIRG